MKKKFFSAALAASYGCDERLLHNISCRSGRK